LGHLDLVEALLKIAVWRKKYNEERPQAVWDIKHRGACDSAENG